MLLEIQYALVFESPLLVASSATSPGVYDRVATLDNNGAPYVPASSLRGRIKDEIRGFLRDNGQSWDKFDVCDGQDRPLTPRNGGSEEALPAADHRGANGLVDNDGEAEESSADESDGLQYCVHDVPCALCRIFGAPGGMRRGFDFTGAHYPQHALDALRDTFGHDRDDVVVASLVRRARNQRDHALRRARADHLFFEGAALVLSEMTGSIRETAAHLQFDHQVRLFDYRLLLLGLRLTTELGASRNRGYGRCEFRSDWSSEIATLVQEWKTARERSLL